MSDSNDGRVVSGTTCFTMHAKYDVDCERKSCPNWVPDTGCHNCAIIGAQSGPKTLQEIGEIYGLTRMRICQIEKSTFKKLRVLINQ